LLSRLCDESNFLYRISVPALKLHVHSVVKAEKERALNFTAGFDEGE
jgi:hypothetical protein